MKDSCLFRAEGKQVCWTIPLGILDDVIVHTKFLGQSIEPKLLKIWQNATFCCQLKSYNVSDYNRIEPM